jgi:hypothetical protein
MPDFKEARQALEHGHLPAFALLDIDQKASDQRAPDLGEIVTGHKMNTHMPVGGFHWVLVKEVKNGMVYFEDPQRVNSAQLQKDPKKKPAGNLTPAEIEEWDNPHNKPRQRPPGYQVDDKTGLASMPLELFEKTMWSMVSRQPGEGTW